MQHQLEAMLSFVAPHYGRVGLHCTPLLLWAGLTPDSIEVRTGLFLSEGCTYGGCFDCGMSVYHGMELVEIQTRCAVLKCPGCRTVVQDQLSRPVHLSRTHAGR